MPYSESCIPFLINELREFGVGSRARHNALGERIGVLWPSPQVFLRVMITTGPTTRDRGNLFIGRDLKKAFPVKHLVYFARSGR